MTYADRWLLVLFAIGVWPVVVTLVILRAYNAARRSLALSSQPDKPELPPYRGSDIVREAVLPVGPLTACPECGAKVLRCSLCGKERTDRRCTEVPS